MTSLLRKPLYWLYLAVLIALIRSMLFLLNVTSPLSVSQNEILLVARGETLTSVLERLEQEGVVRNAFDIRVYARLFSQANSIHAGEYRITPEMKPTTLLQSLQEGDVIYHQLVIPEGWTLTQALAVVQMHPDIAPALPPGDVMALAERIGIEGNPEGQFFPDTYNFTTGTSDVDIFRQAYGMMQSVLTEAWRVRDVGLPLTSAYEALILASIVEKETGLASERPEIAGVFTRRLQQGMRLQTDPTVIYGLGEEFDGDLTRADLRRDTTYNTYTRAGLPPTPIALPGREAIMASVQPAQGDALYFVARGDGSHYFSATLAEHNAAVQRFQLTDSAE